MVSVNGGYAVVRSVLGNHPTVGYAVAVKIIVYPISSIPVHEGANAHPEKVCAIYACRINLGAHIGRHGLNEALSVRNLRECANLNKVIPDRNRLIIWRAAPARGVNRTWRRSCGD